jgi:glycosyltransferase involved in cell wall biosynthesis
MTGSKADLERRALAPELSLVVPSRDGEPTLPYLLDSLLCQETSRTWEVVVVLDGSVDNSQQLLERYVPDLPLRVVVIQSNRGRPAALNAGFAVAGGDVLIRCDDDLRLDRCALERHAQWHGEGHQCAVIGLCRNIMPRTRYAAAYGQAASQRSLQDAYRAPADRRWLHWAANCSVTRATWEVVGPYDETFREYGWEDVDWGYRLRDAGIPIVIDPALEVEHIGAAASTRVRMDRAFRSGRARARFEAKHGALLGPRSSTSPRIRTWNTLVSVGARGHSPEEYARRGGLIDRWSAVVPSRLVSRVIAWGVESAAEAGLRSGRGSL